MFEATVRQHDVVTEVLKRAAVSLGCTEVRTPVVEQGALFARSLGETSDVVGKEMFVVGRAGGDVNSLVLRPEGTAGVARAVLQAGCALPQRLFYAGPMFRHERPQKGRYRQFHQFGVELVGTASPACDVELLAAASEVLAALELQDPVVLELNTLGDQDTRQAHGDALRAYFQEHLHSLSDDSRNRVERGSPLRVLDSKSPGDQEVVADAPSVLEYLSKDAAQRFGKVEAGLRTLGVDYELNPRLVRGLDYYCHTAFEFKCGGSRAGTVLAGGRYDGLFRQLGGKQDVPGIGWAAGIERLAELAACAAIPPPAPITIAPTVDPALHTGVGDTMLLAAAALRRAGHAVVCEWGNRKLSKTLRRVSGDPSARLVVIVGPEEAADGDVTLRDLQSSSQRRVRLDGIASACEAPVPK